MCGRFDTSHLTWREIHDALASFIPMKHRFARTDGAPIWFASLWDRRTTPDAGEVAGFTSMTGPSAGRLADYHDRAPVILEPAEWSAWLDPSQDATELLAAVRPQRFEARAA